MEEQNARTPDEPRIVFRVGINLRNFIVEVDDIRMFAESTSRPR